MRLCRAGVLTLLSVAFPLAFAAAEEKAVEKPEPPPKETKSEPSPARLLWDELAGHLAKKAKNTVFQKYRSKEVELTGQVEKMTPNTLLVRVSRRISCMVILNQKLERPEAEEFSVVVLGTVEMIDPKSMKVTVNAKKVAVIDEEESEEASEEEGTKEEGAQ
ncbi:MAG: hypothetical protein HYU36_16120 [Planctomycetes bacterium]|nr:hypothetical protein [Planctomycetota bacterium]